MSFNCLFVVVVKTLPTQNLQFRTVEPKYCCWNQFLRQRMEIGMPPLNFLKKVDDCDIRNIWTINSFAYHLSSSWFSFPSLKSAPRS